MKEEITKIMQLVKEGKLSPEDAAELMEAFSDAPEESEDQTEQAAQAADNGQTEEESADASEEQAEKPGGSKGNPFNSFIGAVERIGKDVATNIDWNDIASQVRTNVEKGVDAVKSAANEAGFKEGLGSLLGHQEKRTVDLPVDIPAEKALRIESSSGRLRVLGGAELGSLQASATFRAYNQEEAKKKADAYMPIIEEGDDFVLIRLNEGPDSNVDATIRVPIAPVLEIDHHAGDTILEDTGGTLRLNGGSGDLKARGLSGKIEITLASGDVSISEAETTNASIDTKSGDVSLADVTGPMTIKSSSGDISLLACSGRQVTVEVSSGDIKLDLNEPVDGAVSCRTVSGDVNVEIPDGCDARVALSTVSGSISSGLELEDEQKSESKLTGALGEGTGTIDLSTINGAVRIGWRDDSAPEEEATEEE